MEVQRNVFRSITRDFTSFLKEIDLPLFATIVAISFFSVLNLYGIGGADGVFFKRHIFFLSAGIIAMLILASIDYRYFKNYSLPSLSLYVLSLLLLLLTLYSRTVRGTSSWIVLGEFTFEPSELAKLILVILLAKYFSQRHVHIRQFKHIIASGVYFLLPAGIVLSQSDLGSAVIFFCIWIGMLFAAGISKKQIFLIVIIGVVGAYLGWLFVFEDYQKERVISFLNPNQDPRGGGYNLIQSKIAIGSGGLWGVGLSEGSQARLGFLPEPYNDFAFAAAAEQFGLTGIIVLLSFVGLIIYRMFYIGVRSSNNFGRLFCIGMSVFIFSHVFINAGVNIGLIPVTGLPFSFLSYGGSHTVSILAGLGIVQSIKRFSYQA